VEFPSKIAIVVKLKVHGFWLKKTLMDGGSTSINILYDKTLRRMKLSASMIRPTITIFYDIFPRRKASPIGRVYL
jgi:hypothetical protein